MAVNPPKGQSRPRRTRSRAPLVRQDEAKDVRDAILAAIEGLLEERSIEQIPVQEVIEAAGVSRATFYIYFESKQAAVAALAVMVVQRIYDDLWQPFILGTEPPSEALMADHILASLSLWRRHSAVMLAAAGAWRADPVAFSQWGELWSSFVADMRDYVERARANHGAPSDLDAGTLAAMLVWFDETVFYQALSGATSELCNDEQVARTLSGIWMRTIYGRAPFD